MKYGTTGKQGSQRKIKTPILVTTVVADEIKVSPAEVAALGLRHLLRGLRILRRLMSGASGSESSGRKVSLAEVATPGLNCFMSGVSESESSVCVVLLRGSNSPELALFDKWSIRIRVFVI
jgi:hypothetical protein